MQNNDISNKAAPYIAFDIDSLLFTEPEHKPIWTKIADMFKSQDALYTSRPYNKPFIYTLRNLWSKHNISIVLLTSKFTNAEKLDELGKQLDHDMIPYTHLYSFDDWESVREIMGTLQYLFSDNEEFVSFLSANHAMPFSKVKEVFG